jgi:hypothetical protein
MDFISAKGNNFPKKSILPPMNISNLKEFAKRTWETKVPAIIANKETVYACLLALPFVIYAFVQFCLRIGYEFTDAYHWDSHIYWAVGRGIVNGITPWSGLFESKPPGIFILSAISFKIFDSPAFTNFFQVVVLILTAATPIVACFLQSSYKSIPKFAFAALAGLLLALYSADRSGGVQTESLGAAFACIAIFAMAMPNFEKRKILWTSIATVGILGACGFREPFLFVIFGVSIILCNNIKAWFFRFLLPAIIAGLFGVIFLLICGWLGSFLQYLDIMSSVRITQHGSPFLRAMNFLALYYDMNKFSWGLAIALFAILSLPFALFFANSKSDEKKLVIKIAFFGTAFFLASYSVGLGGEYWNHHYIFALPLYMALVLLLLKHWTEEKPAVIKLGLVNFVFLAIATLNLPTPDYNEIKESMKQITKEPRHAAEFLDFKMDELGIDRYTFLGSNFTQIYGYTKHSPDGPYFVQYEWWIRDIPGFGDSLISSINRADIVVMDPIWNRIGGNRIVQANQILNERFTRQQVGRYGIYFRRR